MKNGDLSNQAGVTIGFRCIDLLIIYKDEGVKNKLLNALFGKVKRAEVDEVVRSTMEYIYRNTEYNVDLVIEKKDYTKELKNLLDDMPFNRIVLIDKISQISARLLSGDLSYYIDNDDYRRSLINNRYAISFNELREIVPIKYRKDV